MTKAEQNMQQILQKGLISLGYYTIFQSITGIDVQMWQWWAFFLPANALLLVLLYAKD